VYDWQVLFPNGVEDCQKSLRDQYPVLSDRWSETMVRSKPRVKKDKPVETTEEFVARVNSEARKRNGLKQNLKRARR